MKKVLTLLGLATLLLLVVPAAQAQKFKVLEGDTKALGSIPGLKIEYVYTPMSVGKFDHEADYLAKKVKEYNEKEPGKGDRWKKSWIADRKQRFEPSFEALFNKHAKSTQIAPKGAYKLIMHTTFTEPGYNVVVHRKNASINAVFTILDPAGNVVARIQMSGAPGRSFGGNDYDTGERIEESYAMAGKALAKKYFGK
ncbi:MAG: hypothetical protein EOP54_03705 [Sphingobacteriales bacterium]|nr:MAG: hypothetical protein EOP54_03705 [Sphingobacteriales bacterium]